MSPSGRVIRTTSRHDQRWVADWARGHLAVVDVLVFRRSRVLEPFRIHELGASSADPPVDPSVDDRSWPLIEPGTYWGEPRTDFVMRTRFRVPGEWQDARTLGLYLPLGEVGEFGHPEALVYIDGEPIGACDRQHQLLELPTRYRDGREHLLALHGWTGIGDDWAAPSPVRQFMRPCLLVEVDEPTRDFAAMARVTIGMVEHLPDEEPIRHLLLGALQAAFARIVASGPIKQDERTYRAVEEAHRTLRQAVELAGKSVV